jgi:hypothetical protein
METWKLTEAPHCLDDVVRHALSCGPQRVESLDGDVVVLDAEDYARLTHTADLPTPEAEGKSISFLEMMQRSPLAEAMRSGDWPWEWDDKTRDWVLPGHAVSP